MNTEAIPKQVNYLIDESKTIGPNGKSSYGLSNVISFLHHLFETQGQGEKEAICPADNCGRQNKNKSAIAYFVWRMLRGLHEKLTPCSFMVADHTHCLLDGCFGLLKQKFRRSDCFSLEKLCRLVDVIAACNMFQLVAQPKCCGVKVAVIYLGHVAF